MRTFSFVTVDVFTDRRFGGNPLAVFPDAHGMTDDEMQSLAAEFNLSETTFVLPPADAANTARVRIFNRRSEMPFAGHPNVGTGFVLAGLGSGRAGVLTFEEIAKEKFIHMSATAPVFRQVIDDYFREHGHAIKSEQQIDNLAQPPARRLCVRRAVAHLRHARLGKRGVHGHPRRRAPRRSALNRDEPMFGNQAIPRTTGISRSRIFLRSVLRLRPSIAAALIWLPRVAASVIWISGRSTSASTRS